MKYSEGPSNISNLSKNCLENVAENHEISKVGTKIQNHVWPESIFISEIATNGPLKELNHFIKKSFT